MGRNPIGSDGDTVRIQQFPLIPDNRLTVYCMGLLFGGDVTPSSRGADWGYLLATRRTSRRSRTRPWTTQNQAGSRLRRLRLCLIAIPEVLPLHKTPTSRELRNRLLMPVKISMRPPFWKALSRPSPRRLDKSRLPNAIHRLRQPAPPAPPFFRREWS